MYLKLVFGFLLFITASVFAQHQLIGDYCGSFYCDRTTKFPATAKVVEEGRGYYRLMLRAIPEDPEMDAIHIELNGSRRSGSKVLIIGTGGGYSWNGFIEESKLIINGSYDQRFEMTRISKESPRAGMNPPENAVILLAYKPDQQPDLSAWTNQEWEATDKGTMMCLPGRGGTQTKMKFNDIAHLHLEFMMPNESLHLDQYRGNSGLFVCGTYEVQLLDSYGKIVTSGDCGAIYNIARPKTNASLPPGTWQTYDITFRSARLDKNGNVEELPRITVVHNGIKIHDNLEIPTPTANPKKPHPTQGVISLQHHDNGHRIQFRNIWLVQGTGNL